MKLLSFIRAHGFNLLTACIVALALSRLVPQALKNLDWQGAQAKPLQIKSLEGKTIDLPLAKKHLLVFWATWCGPCTVELKRINDLIADQELAPDDVVAISVGEKPSLVASVAQQEGYRFIIAVDPTGQAATAYQVSGTPTLVLIDENRKIQWMTAGISPSLSFRIRTFFSR